ncbi:hypothetical protein [Butyrivibrio sp. WCE2006]|uniref:hypothetical protein n=1 Tax=Butyrivibrio sp. WCE2006 TaxID=1410611 RepID=UPI0005D1E44A|nr:hypothetical protein [Butyrivibrio sp. WCE2006]
MTEEAGKRAIEKALLYSKHEWYASEKNVMHGIDKNGRYVDTPDITWRGEEFDCGWWKLGQLNVGIPYGWGNASSLEEFDLGIAEGKYAGNVPEDTSRYGSHECVGVDCSGLVTVCWELPKKIRARDIPEIADLIDIKDIRQGDVFAISSHVMLFKEFINKDKCKVRIIDSTRSIGKVSQREFLLADLLCQGYRVYRKK